MIYSPLIVNCFNDEAQCGAYGAHVLLHDSLDDGRLACIVQSPALVRSCHLNEFRASQHQYSHLLVLQPRLSQD